MSRLLTVNGTQYPFPTAGEPDWSSQLGNWAAAVSSTAVGGGGAFTNVKATPYSAVGDGTTNDTASIMAAIEALGEAGGGIVFFPTGTYRVQPSVSGGNCITIDYDNITLLGEGPGASTLQCYVYGGGTPNGTVSGTNFEVITGAVHRGHGILIKSDAINAEEPRKNVRIEGLRIYGQCPRQTGLYPLADAPPTFPASAVNGNGWDLTHKGIALSENKKLDNITISNCWIEGFRGELVYYGGATCGEVVIKDSKLFDSNGSIVSMTADLTVRNCEIYDGTHGVECSHFQRDMVFDGNTVRDCTKGIVITANITYTSAPWGKVSINNNTVHDCPHEGIYITGWTENVTGRGNKVIDCGSTIEKGMVRVDDQYSGTPHNILFEDNELIADTVDCPIAFYTTLGGTGITARNVKFNRNRLLQSSYGLANGNKIAASYRHNVTSDSDVSFTNNDISGASYIPNHISGNIVTLPFLSGNIGEVDVFTSIRTVGATGDNPIYAQAERIALWAQAAGYYLVPAMKVAGVKDKQRCTITAYDGTKVGYFNHSTTGVKLKNDRARFITAGVGGYVTLVLEFDSTLDLWIERDFFHDSKGEVAANDCWLASESSDNLAPNVHARGCDLVVLAPTGATNYTDPVDFPPGQICRVKCNANTTIVHAAAKFLLTGAANFAPGGTGGEIFLVRASTAAATVYEIARFAY